jgi:hypothetical protein
MSLPPNFGTFDELPPGYRDALVKHMKALVDWCAVNNIDNDESVPVLALTCGTIIKHMARIAPQDNYQAHLDEGIAIACAMIRTAATMKTKP